MVVEGRSLGKTPSHKENKVTLRFLVSRKEVLVEKPGFSHHAQTIVGGMEAGKRLSAMAKELVAKGEQPAEVERVLRHMSDRMDLSLLVDFADTALSFLDKLRKPLFWIERIADHVSKSRSSPLATFRLFSEAKDVQGTDAEQVLLRTMGG